MQFYKDAPIVWDSRSKFDIPLSRSIPLRIDPTKSMPGNNGHTYVGEDPRTGRPVTGLLIGLKHLPTRDWLPQVRPLEEPELPEESPDEIPGSA